MLRISFEVIDFPSLEKMRWKSEDFMKGDQSILVSELPWGKLVIGINTLALLRVLIANSQIPTPRTLFEDFCLKKKYHIYAKVTL